MFFKTKEKTSLSHFKFFQLFQLTFSVNHALGIVEFLNRQRLLVTQTSIETDRSLLKQTYFLKAKMDIAGLFLLSLCIDVADICKKYVCFLLNFKLFSRIFCCYVSCLRDIRMIVD